MTRSRRMSARSVSSPAVRTDRSGESFAAVRFFDAPQFWFFAFSFTRSVRQKRLV